jgi:hypothetical protein
MGRRLSVKHEKKHPKHSMLHSPYRKINACEISHLYGTESYLFHTSVSLDPVFSNLNVAYIR